MTKQELAGQLAKQGEYILELMGSIAKDRETINMLVTKLLELKAQGHESPF